MEKIRINLDKKVDDSYDLIIGRDLFKDIANGLKNLKIAKIAVITDSNIKKLYGNTFLSILKGAGLNAFMISFRAGEKSKTRYTKEKIEDALLSDNYGRDSLIIALGGGVVGDLAGFLAATYMRGISFLQIPTTLLAMVDSSIGGKTGINTDLGKNLVGAFHQPKRVFIDTDLLSTLPKVELQNGLIEMIKHSIILDEKYFRFLDDYAERFLLFSRLDEKVLIHGIKKSCEIKKSVIEGDELENSIRKILNFGHTIGHAIEKTSNYKITHGHAVALGMVAETKIAEELGLIDPINTNKIINLISKVGFSLKLRTLSIKEIIKNTHFDKKNKGGIVKYVLPIKIGKMQLDTSVNEKTVNKILGEMK